MLNDMATALAEDAGRNLILAPFFADQLERTHGALRRVVAAGALAGLPVPALACGPGLVRHDAHRARHREHDPGASATSSARMASNGSTVAPASTAPGAATADRGVRHVPVAPRSG